MSTKLEAMVRATPRSWNFRETGELRRATMGEYYTDTYGRPVQAVHGTMVPVRIVVLEGK